MVLRVGGLTIVGEATMIAVGCKEEEKEDSAKEKNSTQAWGWETLYEEFKKLRCALRKGTYKFEGLCK